LEACAPGRSNSWKIPAAALLLAVALPVSAAEWVQTNVPLWGLEKGLRFALHPAGFGSGVGGPRGLIRIGAPVLPGGAHALVNFIAVEPVVKGKRGYSEMEPSPLDAKPGLRMTAGTPARSMPAPGVEQLEVPVDVESFASGARIRVVLAQRTDAPDELRCSVFTRPGSAPVDDAVLTATMGNMVRTRRLWLADATLHGRTLYPDFSGGSFAPHREFPLARIARTAAGDAIVAITGDEPDPASVVPFPERPFWHYAGAPVTQYWKVPGAEVASDLRVVVNARADYWMSRQPIPGGPAFENFEMRTRFREGQTFVFGVSKLVPGDLMPRVGAARAERRGDP
jgi:hypothetical protein